MVSRVQAILATDEHADSLAAFYRAAWGGDVTAEAVLAARRQAAAENSAAPGEVPPTAIVLEGTRVLGYCGSIPHRLWDGVAEHPAYWVKGLMVLPEYRRGPIGFLVGKELATQLPRATALVVAPAARRLFSALGYTDLGAVTNFVRPLRLASLARRLDPAELGLGLPRWLTASVRVAQRVGVAGLAGVIGGLALRLVAAARGRAPSRLTTRCAGELPSGEELDALWRGARRGMAAGPVRDGTYLRWRYGAEGRRYSFISARDGTRLVGVAVLLATPYLYVYDLVALAVPMAFLVRLGLKQGFMSCEIEGLILASTLVFIIPLSSGPAGLLAILVIALLIGRRAVVVESPPLVPARASPAVSGAKWSP